MEVIADPAGGSKPSVLQLLSSLPFGMEVIADLLPKHRSPSGCEVFIAFRHGGHC